MVVEVELMDLSVVCQSFPDPIENYLDRGNMLDSIESILQGNVDIVIIDGESGIGKTTLMADFVKRYPLNAISFFINVSSKYGYDPEFARFDIANQINWLINQRELSSSEKIDDGFLRTKVIDLRRKARHKMELFYFVIDGLNEIPDDQKYIREIIFDMLPIGIPGFKFIISSDDYEAYADLLKNKKVNYRPFTLSAFTYEQTLKYLENLNLDSATLQDIHKTFKGKPEYLASLYRLVESGVNIESLMYNIADHFPDPFDWEWNQVDKSNTKLLTLLAVLSNDFLHLNLESILEIAGYDSIISMEDDIKKLTFISLTETSITFVSDAYKKYVSNQLNYMKEKVENLIADYLIQDPTQDESFKYLPNFLFRSGRTEELITFLNTENYNSLLLRTQSSSLLNQATELGVKASKILNLSGELFRFSLQNSIIKESFKSKVWISEVKARMSLNEYDGALSLTQNSVLIEDRLHMLAIIAKHKKIQGLTPQPEILEQIENLYSRIDYKKIGTKAIKIASELVYTHPDLAIELIENLTQSENKENALDWALASLPFLSMEGTQIKDIETFEDIKSKIKDPDAKLFSAEVSLLVRDYKALEILSEVKNLESTSDKLFLLANWASRNKKIEEAYEVIKYALEIAVSTTTYAPNAKIYNDLSTQLPFIDNYESSSELVEIFDSQIVNIQRAGPTEDYISLQLNLFKTQSKYNLDKASERIVDLYFYINEINDISILAAGLAKLLSVITVIDSNKYLESTEGLHTTVERDLEIKLEEILNQCAAHSHETKNIIKSLSYSLPNKALTLIEKINTENKRDNSYLVFINSYINSESEADYSLLYKVINKIKNLNIRDEGILSIVEHLFKNKPITDEDISVLMPILDTIQSMHDLEHKIRCCCIVHSILKDSSKYSQLSKHYLDELNYSWNSIDLGWRKIDNGYKIVEFLTECSIEKAREYLSLTEEIREEITLTDGNLSWAYKHSLLLVIRIYKGLVIKGINNQSDFNRIEQFINLIPSFGERALIWNDLALRLFEHKKIEIFHEIVRNKIKPALKQISDHDKRYKYHIIKEVSPALYLSHPLTAYDIFNEMEQIDKDKAFRNIATYILYKKSPFDPIDNTPGEGGDLTYEEVLDICNLIQYASIDHVIYSLTKDIADTINSNKNRNKFSKEQKLDIAGKLLNITSVA